MAPLRLVCSLLLPLQIVIVMRCEWQCIVKCRSLLPSGAKYRVAAACHALPRRAKRCCATVAGRGAGLSKKSDVMVHGPCFYTLVLCWCWCCAGLVLCWAGAGLLLLLPWGAAVAAPLLLLASAGPGARAPGPAAA